MNGFGALCRRSKGDLPRSRIWPTMSPAAPPVRGPLVRRRAMSAPRRLPPTQVGDGEVLGGAAGADRARTQPPPARQGLRRALPRSRQRTRAAQALVRSAGGAGGAINEARPECGGNLSRTNDLLRVKQALLSGTVRAQSPVQ